MKVRDFVTKKCFYEKKDGTMGVMLLRSVVLENGLTIRWNRKGECWSLKSAPRWSSAVATSLNTRAMVVAIEKGRLRSETETFHAFSNFQTRLLTLVDIDTAVNIIMFLKG